MVRTMSSQPTTDLQYWRFTVDQYEQLGRSGVFDDDRVELLDGQIVCMRSIGPPHASIVCREREQPLCGKDYRIHLDMFRSIAPPRPDMRQAYPTCDVGDVECRLHWRCS